ncbi:hypothetical protein EV361DRAFT_797823 [Lentinula raphanica]|nr:hypothetical protein F5880DRAFT_1484640 [Lentinula raphanica]KAJ3972579.1 hypothetical protein EV361DRAFT_797823 [Lentinula raphanica]
MAAEANEYPIRIQCLIPLALCILHNFLRVFDPSRHASELLPATREQPVGDPHGDLEPRTNMVRETESTRANARRDAIATAMWEQYQAELQARRTASTQSV